jgi:protein gp37
MNKTKIDWADYTWNPVTGCLHDCSYCYARKQSLRFTGDMRLNMADPRCEGDKEKGLYILRKPFVTRNGRSISYPFGFAPTLHEYRLDWPGDIKNGTNIFVCSMADLFGEWVSNEWIERVFNSCEKYPQHNYMFLTKNPGRFKDFFLAQKLHIADSMWFGFSIEDQHALNKLAMGARWLPQNTFISIEPIHGPVDLTRIEPDGKDAYLNFLNGGQYWFMGGDDKGKKLKWVIVGAETGNRRGKVIPEREWITSIVKQCQAAGVPVFMKESLRELMGNDFIQMFPNELNRHSMSRKLKGKLYTRCSICKQEHKKSDMMALLAREKRGAGAKALGYACMPCFERLKSWLESDKPMEVQIE